MPQIIGNTIIELNKVDSTNRYANEILSKRKQDISEGTVIWAFEQFAGKGQQDTVWESEPQKNLTFSIILFPTFLEPKYLFSLNQTIALCIYDFVKSIINKSQIHQVVRPDVKSNDWANSKSQISSNNIFIKWPNDIYVVAQPQPFPNGREKCYPEPRPDKVGGNEEINKKLLPPVGGENLGWAVNKKIAGILIENTITESTVSSSVIGIGLNVNQEKFQRNIPNPTSLRIITGKTYDLMACLKELLRMIDERYRNVVISCGFQKIKNDYLSALLGYNEVYKYKDIKTSEIFNARIVDVKETGELVLEKDDGVKAMYGFKEIEFVI